MREHLSRALGDNHSSVDVAVARVLRGSFWATCEMASPREAVVIDLAEQRARRAK